MSYLKLFLFCLCIATCYYAMAISVFGIAASGGIFWWFKWSDNFHFYHIAQNFVGLAIVAFVPSFLVHNYEPQQKWLSIFLVLILSILFLGNMNHMPFDPSGFIRFFNSTFINGDLGSIAVFLELVSLPVIWLFVLKRISSYLLKSIVN